jgi:hypothetical protein
MVVLKKINYPLELVNEFSMAGLSQTDYGN